jgi:type II secretory pathway pseudopilin PulG
MSGSQATNNQAVQFEQQQAAEADAKEAARQQRLQQGTDVINKLFDPQPVTTPQTSQFDWSTFQTPNPLAVQWAAQNNAPTPQATGVPAGYTATAGGGLQDASGKVYQRGSPLSITTQVPVPGGGTTGGFGDDFYNNYKNTYLNYYLPDEARQYDVAKRDLTYNLARAGTLNSSAAADKAGDLAYNDANAQATIKANANQATGQLQQSVQDQKQSLINQLYSTEDPTLTANLAQSAANATKLVSPNLTPAAAFFTPALTAAGAAASTYLSPYSTYPGVGGTTGGANVVPANQSQGKVQGGSY